MKKPGGYTGPYTQPSLGAAPGVWVAPVEVYDATLSGNWPLAYVPDILPAVEPGDIIDIIATGVYDAVNALPNYQNTLAIASGGRVNRNSRAELFAITGTRFGNGDGSTTFNVINIPSDFSYLRGTTTSGLTYPQGYQASGVLPAHTHTITIGNSFRTAQKNPGSNAPNSAQINNLYTTNSNRNSFISNEARHQQIIHCVVTSGLPSAPVGSLVTYLLPNQTLAGLDQTLLIPSGSVIPSGQELNRVTFSKLFNRIGTLYGSGNGSTTFNVPNYLGLFLRGSSNSNYITISGKVGPSGYILDRVAAHVHKFGPVYTEFAGDNSGNGSRLNLDPTSTDSSTSSIGGVETRPKNISAIYLLVTEGLI
jgi:microcystin-dependent protein